MALPYFLIVEFFGPAIELLGYIGIIFGLWFHIIDIRYAVAFSLLMIVYGSLISVGAVLLEEWGQRKYNEVSDLFRLFFYALSESFWYRPLMTISRLQGMFELSQRKQGEWGKMTHKKGVLYQQNPSFHQ